ncbi:hypothetical protein BGZ82_000021 [Podila clonocystis]|nr:hypothetical protein BGZ82_000021 [Podila clonocystis]
MLEIPIKTVKVYGMEHFARDLSGRGLGCIVCAATYETEKWPFSHLTSTPNCGLGSIATTASNTDTNSSAAKSSDGNANISKSTASSAQSILNESNAEVAPEELEEAEEADDQADAIFCKVIAKPVSMHLPKIPSPVPAPQSRSVEEAVLLEAFLDTGGTRTANGKPRLRPNSPPVLAKDFAAVLTGSTYKSTLQSREYAELTPDLLNRVKVYAQAKTLDAHCENFSEQNSKSDRNSWLPAFKTPYPGVWPVSIRSTFEHRLIIGTRFFDALVTSCLRLDRDFVAEPQSVGASTLNFELASDDDSFSGDGAILSRIFVRVALAVIEAKDKAGLLKEAVIKLRQNTESRSARRHIDAFLAIFPEGVHEIPILGNLQLNKALENLVPPITNGFHAANEAAKAAIQNEFTQFNK